MEKLMEKWKIYLNGWKNFLSNKKQLEKTDKKKLDELIRRFYFEKWEDCLINV